MAIIVEHNEPKLKLNCDNVNDVFIAKRTCEGEPFRNGIKIGVENHEVYDKDVTIMLCDYEATELRDFLLMLYPLET